MQRILAIVVLYFPEKPVDEIIGNFKNHVDEVMVVDNTGDNRGVAAALNKGLQKAIAEGYDWLLTMDQDSSFEDGALSELKKIALTSRDDIAIVSPFHFIKRTPKNISIHEVPFTMTSGDLLRISAAKKAGMFKEELFIDSVDNEYCLRLRSHGFKIIRVNSSILHHHLGKPGPFNTVTHNADRRYYITRNMLYVMRKYFPRFFLFGSKELIKSFLLIVFVEDDKGAKLGSMLRGMRDWTKISR